MKLVADRNTNLTGPIMQWAKLGATHGYRFDGDTVHLHAMFTVTHPTAHERQWALQLWACSTAPSSARDLAGSLVAEVILPPMGEIADDIECFETSGQALLPAGTWDHLMVLALVSKTAGLRDEVHDLAVYPRREQFCLPRFSGIVGYRVREGRVVIEVERIENSREAGNLSGTLALELWALSEPYRGGGFSGVPLAGVAFDPLSGQCEYRQLTFDVPFVPPPTGTWNVVLMLREWTAAGHVTRDFTNFAVPMTIAATVRAAAALPAATRPSKAPTSSKAAAAPASISMLVSVNKATKEELVAIKGLPTKVAEGIVAKRPFRSLDELLKVKGMGEKLLAKLRSKLRL